MNRVRVRVFENDVFTKPDSLDIDSHRIAHKNVKVQLKKMLIESMSLSGEIENKITAKKNFEKNVYFPNTHSRMCIFICGVHCRYEFRFFS